MENDGRDGKAEPMASGYTNIDTQHSQALYMPQRCNVRIRCWVLDSW
jgi:hypothetical protein